MCKSCNQNDSLLFPVSLGELIPENHPVRTVSAIIGRLDISGIESTYKGGGTSSFHPRMLLKVIVYSYMCNVYCWPTDRGTMIPFLKSFRERYGRQSEEIVADSGYGNEQNYAYMAGEGIDAYVKCTMFHAEMKRKYRDNAFLVQNMYYHEEQDYYVCPMGQHQERAGTRSTVSDLGYRSSVAVYRAVNCKGCPLRGMCYKGRADRRTIEVNHTANAFKRKARELLTGERSLMHRSRRPIEPEAVFGDIKFNHGFRRFRLKSNRKVKVEFGLVALAHNLRKYAAHVRDRLIRVSDNCPSLGMA